MDVTQTQGPQSRREYERNINIAQEKIENGKVRFRADKPDMINPLLKVRKLPNGRANFLTVDEGARNMVNTFSNIPNSPFPVEKPEE